MTRFFLLGMLLFTSANQLFAQSGELKPIADLKSEAITDQERVSYPTSTMIKIKKKNIGEELRSTLMNVAYVGWESGELYIDQKTSDYALFLPDKYYEMNSRKSGLSSTRDQTTPGQWHFFSSEGRPISLLK